MEGVSFGHGVARHVQQCGAVYRIVLSASSVVWSAQPGTKEMEQLGGGSVRRIVMFVVSALAVVLYWSWSVEALGMVLDAS